jgi:translocator protein
MVNISNFALTIQTWYMSINRPPWAPPVWAFGLAWGIIYPLVIASFGYVFWKSFVKHEWRRYIGVVFAINLVFNLIYSLGTYLVFAGDQTLAGVQQYYWPATFVVGVVFLTLPILMIITWERAKWVALAQLPYLIWILIAAPLQLVITFTN